MHAVLTNLGSTGDIQPFLALAREFVDHGHTAVVATAPNFEVRVKSLGLEFCAIGPKYEVDELRAMISAMLWVPNWDQQLRPVLMRTLESLPQMYRQLSEVCDRADVLIGGPTQPAARMVHDRSGIAFVSVHMASFGDHWGTPLIREASAPIVNVYRRREGLPPLRDPLTTDAHSPEMVLYAISKHVLRRPACWPAHYHIAGYFFLDESIGTTLDGDLEQFLSDEPAPILVTFGSLMHDDPDGLCQMVLDAAEKVGCRVLIQEGSTGLGRQFLPRNARKIGFLPYQDILPRVACVVHHGGAGTTASVLRAGIPSIVVPHIAEQPIWGELARELGCASDIIPYSMLTSDRLAQSLNRVLCCSAYRDAATCVAARIRDEDGVVNARLLVEDFLERRFRSSRPS